jgi:acetyl-CoA synthetase
MSKELVAGTDAWDRVVESLDHDPAEGLNMAHECCERWATDRGRLALSVRHADGSVERLTYFELAREAARASAVFADAGLRRGDRIAAVLGRQVEAWIAAFAAWRSGLVYVPLFAGFGGEALAQRMRAAEARTVIVDQECRGAVEDAIALLEWDVEVFTVAGARGGGVRRGDRSFWAEMERAEPDGPRVETAADETAVIMFTSGTTSVPKGCVIPHSGFLALLPWFDHSCALTEGDVLFTTTDPGWSFGLLSTGITAMARGLPRVMYSGPFDPRAWFEVIEAEQVTHVASVPTAFRSLVAAGRRFGIPACVTGATSAGEPLDAETVSGWTELTGGAPIRDGYGQTELGMLLANLEGDEIVPGALASVVPGWTVRLLDEENREIEGPGRGAIVVRRRPFQLTADYVNAPDLWRARWIDGEWFRTGDIAERDSDGRWWFVGRDDDVIVTAGYNVGPAEIESVLLSHDAVAEAAVVAASDPSRGGSAVRAVLVLAEGRSPSDSLTKELQDAVRSGIGRHAYPRIVEYVDSLPKTETGKIRRAYLRQQRLVATGG